MNKIFFLTLAAVALGACSTKSLLTFNLDGASFVPASSRSGSFPVSGLGTLDCRLPDDDGDATNCNDANGGQLSLPALSFLTAVKFKASLTLSTSATGTLDLYIAPDNATDIYTAQYKVLTSTTSGASFAAEANLSASSSDPAQQQAFKAIESGKFRYGVRIRASATPNSTVQYAIKDLFVSVSGYPIKALFP